MKKKIFILGVGGMVGHKLFAEFSKRPELDVYATTRAMGNLERVFGTQLTKKIMSGVDVNRFETITRQIKKLKPDVVINCIGITKQLVRDDAPTEAIAINSLMPHLLAQVCKENNARLIQMATDCVFNGSKGDYLESDPSDATDTYGRTKFLGEVYYPHCLTVRTSFIGHELTTSHGLLNWFLSQEGETLGYTKAIYSGMPTVEIARVMAELILPNKDLKGLYHVSSQPISKYDLLHLIARQYGKEITIKPDDSVKIDRSLNSERFREKTGFKPASWQSLIKQMYLDYNASSYYSKKS